MNANKHQLFIGALRQLHSVKWINQYYNLLDKLLTDIDINGDDERLAMSVTNKALPVNLGQRYILKPYSGQRIGIIVPSWFDEHTVGGEVNFEFTKDGRLDAKWIVIDFPLASPLSKPLYNACVEACTHIVQRTKRSGYRRYHVPLLYEFTTERSVRDEVLNELALNMMGADYESIRDIPDDPFS